MAEIQRGSSDAPWSTVLLSFTHGTFIQPAALAQEMHHTFAYYTRHLGIIPTQRVAAVHRIPRQRWLLWLRLTWEVVHRRRTPELMISSSVCSLLEWLVVPHPWHWSSTERFTRNYDLPHSGISRGALNAAEMFMGRTLGALPCMPVGPCRGVGAAKR